MLKRNKHLPRQKPVIQNESGFKQHLIQRFRFFTLRKAGDNLINFSQASNSRELQDNSKKKLLKLFTPLLPGQKWKVLYWEFP